MLDLAAFALKRRRRTVMLQCNITVYGPTSAFGKATIGAHAALSAASNALFVDGDGQICDTMDSAAQSNADRAQMFRTTLALGAFASSLGFLGVALAAAAAHSGASELARTASLFLILHAAALLGLSAGARSSSAAPALITAGFALGVGASIFAADLASRAFGGDRLFPFAAPIGGSLMSLSWLALAILFATAAIRGR